MKEKEVEEFIKRRFPIDCNWTSGNCYYFAKILEARFPFGRIWYDTIKGHFMYQIGDFFYDYTGSLGRFVYKHYIPWDRIDKYDKNVKERLIRDCIK